MHILGISAFYHDSAAALVRDGAVIAACQEERFSRVKHDWRFPARAVDACLREAGIRASDLDAVVFYDKPFLKFERILETYMATAPAGIRSFIASMPLWIKRKMWMKSLIEEALEGYKGRVLFTEHHQAHAASAFFPSPFREAAVVTADGVGEWATTSVGLGRDNRITLLKEIHFPHSLGMLYSAFTYYTGFKVNSGEYKVMGLAPYGRPVYLRKILDHLIDLKPDGSFRLNMKYFNYCAGLTMTHSRFHRLFGGPPRRPETPLTQRDMDLARSVQDVVETAMLYLARFAKKETGSDRLCLAGGVALNCVANGRILRENIFKDIWIQPASGDAGGALGAALAVWHEYHGKSREADGVRDRQSGSLLGPAPDGAEIRAFLDGRGALYRAPGEETLIRETAERLAAGKVVGWFSGRMEFGPRALGCRSILGDPRSPVMQKVMNLKIKFRESFRPFAPAVLETEAGKYFEIESASPYMLLVADVRKELRKPETDEESARFGIDRLNAVRSVIPAVTHVDYSARLQTVNAETNPRFHGLLTEFNRLTGCPVLVNTSFNVRGEPLVCSPSDAYACFMRTDMDALVLGDCLLDKSGQPAFEDDPDWRKRFALD